MFGINLKPFWQHRPIKQKLIWITMLASSSALLFAIAAFVAYDLTSYRQSLTSDLLTRLQVWKINTAAPLAFQDRAAALENLAPLRADSRIIAAVIYDNDDRIFAEYRRDSDTKLPPYQTDIDGIYFFNSYVDLSAPVHLDREIIGHIAIRFDLSGQQARLLFLLLISAGLLIISSAVAFFIASRLQRSITDPIAELTHVAKLVSQQQDYTVQAATMGSDEIGTLAASLNGMLLQIHKRDLQLLQHKENLEQQVAERTADLLRANNALREREERYRHLIDHANDIIFQADIDGRFIHFNPTTVRITKYSAAELTDRSYLDLVHQDYREAAKSFYRQQVLEQTQSTSYEFPLIAKNGAVVWLNQQMQLLLTDGRVAGFQAIARDITERKLAEEALQYAHDRLEQLVSERTVELQTTISHLKVEITEREQVTKALQQSEKRFAKAFRASPYPVGITELETGRTIDVNDACLQLFGFERNEVIGHTTLMLGIWPNPDDRRNLILQLQTGEPVLNRELNFRTKSGQIRHILISADIIELDNVRCMITVGNDITDRKQAENALQTFQDQVRQMQKMEALGQLAGGVAHDFNNLLTAILGNANIAVSKIPLDHPLHPNLSRIIEAGGRASQLVQQILAFTHQQELSRSVQPLSPIVSEVLTLLRATLPAHVMLTSTVNADTPPVQADSTQLHQVMMNLCTNAWHALKDQPGSITIDLAPANLTQPLYSFHTTLPPGLYARLSIRDTGCGMNSETISRIFDPFFTTKPVGQGTGLGLSVVHSIIQKHEGTIVVESQPNRGTTFHLYFPAAQADHADNSVEVPTIRHQEQGRHLLYLDDEAMLVELIEALFEAKGFRVTGYTDATEALNAVRAAPSQFDLVVTDYNMPKMSGLDVAQALAKIRADLPVVLVSGYLSPDAQAAAIKAEIKGIVYKPTMLQRLEDVVANILHPPPSA